MSRTYKSAKRNAGAERTRSRILEAGKNLFARHGIDATTIAQIAARARVSEATVYATVQSKAGLVQAVMEEAIFGPRFQQAQKRLAGETDPVKRIELTAEVARAVYENESAELSLLFQASAFSADLRKTQLKFEILRREMQRDRIEALYKAGRARNGLHKGAASDLMWMFTSREIYRKLVHESGWTPQEFENWLKRTLAEALTDIHGAVAGTSL